MNVMIAVMMLRWLDGAPVSCATAGIAKNMTPPSPIKISFFMSCSSNFTLWPAIGAGVEDSAPSVSETPALGAVVDGFAEPVRGALPG